MLLIQDQKRQELCHAIELMDERQELLATMMEREKIRQSEFPKQIFQEIKGLEESCQKKNGICLEKKHCLERLNKERRRAKKEE